MKLNHLNYVIDYTRAPFDAHVQINAYCDRPNEIPAGMYDWCIDRKITPYHTYSVFMLERENDAIVSTEIIHHPEVIKLEVSECEHFMIENRLARYVGIVRSYVTEDYAQICDDPFYVSEHLFSYVEGSNKFAPNELGVRMFNDNALSEVHKFVREIAQNPNTRHECSIPAENCEVDYVDMISIPITYV